MVEQSELREEVPSLNQPGAEPPPVPVRRTQALTVVVDDRGVESALRTFKKLVMREGLLKDLKRHEHYEKPGDRRRRKTREAIRRRRRQAARVLRVRGGAS
jgi:small subunit ribosomal protein S21